MVGPQGVCYLITRCDTVILIYKEGMYVWIILLILTIGVSYCGVNYLIVFQRRCTYRFSKDQDGGTYLCTKYIYYLYSLILHAHELKDCGEQDSHGHNG